MTSMKEKALALARKGFAVFPLQPNSKKPMAGSAGFKDATTNDFEIEAWWTEHPDANIGLYPDACRPRLLIVDVDTYKGGTETYDQLFARGLLPSGPCVQTPRGGWHLYYALAADEPAVQSSVEKKLGKGVDVRAHGGYVVAPGSTIDGKPYKFLGAMRSPPMAPATLIEACGRVEERHPEAEKWLVEPDLDINVKHARDWLKQTEPAVEGAGGHAHAYQTAAMLRDRGVSDRMALGLMLDHWNDHCSPPWSEEELAMVTDNAYRYAKRPAGCEAFSRKAEALIGRLPVTMAALQATACEPEPEKQVRTPYSRLRPVGLDELAKRPPPRWLVKGVFPERGLGGIIGQTRSYKSFIALDAALHIVLGLPWMGLKTLQGPVVYIAGEGAPGIGPRARAWLTQHDIKENPKDFYLVEAMPAFSDLEAIRTLAGYLKPLKPRMVILDTVARAMAGLDENSVQGASSFVSVADQLGHELQAFVLCLHHLGKDEKKGSRGSTALPAALDVMLSLQGRQETREALMRMPKAKDAEEWADARLFKGHRVDLGVDEDGASINSLAFTYQGLAKPGNLDEDDNSTRAIAATRWDALHSALEGRGVNEALTNRSLAGVIAQATTAEDDWPEEGAVREDLIASALRFLTGRVATSDEGKRWLLDPSAAAKNRRWRDPDRIG